MDPSLPRCRTAWLFPVRSPLLLTRGKSRYDAVLKWKSDQPEADLAGYAVV
jgi:hypothetical protein